MSDEELVKHCMCGCMYLEAECPNCNKVTDADRIEALTVEREFFEEEWVSAVDKLNKAVEGLREICGNGDATGRNPQLMANIARTTLAEIEGSTSEGEKE